MTDHEDLPPPREVDLDRPGWARITDYLLRGKDNYAVDRQVADAMAAVYGGLARLAKAQRRFLMRAVRYQATHLGVRQFLELGAGFPATTNTHDVAQDIDPAARIVSVTPDPLVAAHLRALLVSTPTGRAEVIQADPRKPNTVLDDPILADTLDHDAPVGLLLGSVLEHLFDEAAHTVVGVLLGALPAGSVVTVTHPTADFHPAVERLVGIADQAGLVFWPRTRQQVGELFAGLELVEPGVVPLPAWRPATELDRQLHARGVDAWVGMARKPT